MADFVQLWVYLSSTPLFGLTATLVVYVLAQAFYGRMGQAAWANPVLWSVLTLAVGLTLTGTAYPTYFSGAQFIHFLLGPAVVALAWPLWQRRAVLRARFGRFAIASLAGGAAAAISATGIAWLLDLPHDVLLSMAPKSVTAPVAMGVAEKIGGIPALAAVFAVVTGMVGALSGKYLFDLLRIGTDSNGWMRQKKPSVSTMCVARNCSRSVPGAAEARRSGTTVKRMADVTRQKPVNQKNSPCQLITDRDHCTGRVAAIEPMPPAIMWKPVIRPQRSGGNQSVIALMAPIRPPANPSPIRTRATISSGSDELRPNRADPSAARASSSKVNRDAFFMT